MKILPRKRIEWMWTPLYPTSADTVGGEWMGFSFFVSKRDGTWIVRHDMRLRAVSLTLPVDAEAS
ncbi:MAG TPA: hypothetical protein VLE53_07195 [Gemmatimonadaceae bacterium]|nr:hypothetical protein [Gemmatimonadaceae bacterium]